MAEDPIRSQPGYSESANEEKSNAPRPVDDSSSDDFRTIRDSPGDEEAGFDRRQGNDLEKTPTSVSYVGALAARTLSVVRTKESGKDLDPPPDGGFQACFGVFQTYYTETLGRSASDISWVGSIQIFLLFFIGTFSGRATDAGYFKVTLTIGAVLELFCIFMTSLCTQYWQLFLAQGLGQGIGCGLMFCPTIALTPTYFTTKRSVAIGIVASGSATGGLVFPAVVMRLLPRIGFGWTMRTLGFISLATLTPCIIFLKQRLPPRKSGPIVEWAAFKELSYSFFAIGMFLNFWGLYIGFFYIGSFSREVIGVSTATSINVLLLMNGIGLLGRVIPNHMADRFTGPLNMLIPFSFATGLVSFCWAGVHNLSGVYGWAAIYGLVAAGIQSLFPATLSTLTTDLKKMGARMGMIMSVVGVAALIGSPIAGALVERGDGDYLYAQMFMGSSQKHTTLLILHSATYKGKMAPRGRGGKFGKPSRGGGKHFSRDIQTVDKDGNPVSMWREPADDPETSEEEDGSTKESESEEEEAGPSTSTRDNHTPSQPQNQTRPELTREERRALARAKKAAGAARRAEAPAQPGGLPPSDSESDSASPPVTNGKGKAPAAPEGSEDEDLPANPNYSKPKKTEDGEAQLSRREREAIEAQQARERYMKLHAEGKTDEARADLARLAIVRERREEERLRKEAEKEEKAELARQRAEEREKLLAKKGAGKRKGKK
ncbi:putative MFS monocarboxylate transporter [Aspergillus undulatus]|uniref:putative MFS monocarboxylate transporter n=1 Tax=Aspergillus undulatus TaxID=1810928 RepID=UPI003CCD2763